MNRFLAAVLCCLLLLGCASTNRGGLAVTGGGAPTFVAGDGTPIRVRRYALSDGSLNFVKVTLPDGEEYTLPQAMSASGIRFTDDIKVVWWEKGRTAFMQTRNENGGWVMRYEDCVLADPAR